MEQLVGVHHHHSSSSSLSPRTPSPTHPLPHLLRLPSSSNRLRPPDHPHSSHPVSKLLRVTPPFFLVLLAAVYLLASFTIFSSPAASLRPTKNRPKLLLPMPAPSPPPPDLFELHGGRIRAWITNVGATVTSLLVPDNNGVLGDVVLGFDSLDPYQEKCSTFNDACLNNLKLVTSTSNYGWRMALHLILAALLGELQIGSRMGSLL
ncbi:Os09g0108600 [Oryza sativa Japonica Group]|uniref:Os09g0108600 protein n=1 Tax=Oryza sativa subsp. japonica TaxID=39947 RepID=B7E8R4_ORYSJ|nr:unnamed protein product [Oryza sativa Japonica Group]BAT06811.1 Os09g0108600 [Oryza sativa Japonica Group]